MKKTDIKVLIVLLSLGILAGPGMFAGGEGTPTPDATMTHDECIQHLFEHLELVDRNTVLNVNEKMEALRQLRFQPREGYLLGTVLLYGQLADIFIRVYALEDKLPKDFTQMNAIRLLVDEGIFHETFPPSHMVDRTKGIELIDDIPRSPVYKQRTILLPRGLREPAVSRCE